MNKTLILGLALSLSLAACNSKPKQADGTMMSDTIRNENAVEEQIDSAKITEPADNTAAPGADSTRSAPAAQ